jgi:hypothetical protein
MESNIVIYSFVLSVEVKLMRGYLKRNRLKTRQFLPVLDHHASNSYVTVQLQHQTFPASVPDGGEGYFEDMVVKRKLYDYRE